METKIEKLIQLITPHVDNPDHPIYESLINLEVNGVPDFELTITDDDGSEFEDVPSIPGDYVLEMIYGRQVLTIRCTEEVACFLDPVNDTVLDAAIVILEEQQTS